MLSWAQVDAVDYEGFHVYHLECNASLEVLDQRHQRQLNAQVCGAAWGAGPSMAWLL